MRTLKVVFDHRIVGEHPLGHWHTTRGQLEQLHGKLHADAAGAGDGHPNDLLILDDRPPLGKVVRIYANTDWHGAADAGEGDFCASASDGSPCPRGICGA